MFTKLKLNIGKCLEKMNVFYSESDETPEKINVNREIDEQMKEFMAPYEANKLFKLRRSINNWLENQKILLFGYPYDIDGKAGEEFFGKKCKESNVS